MEKTTYAAPLANRPALGRRDFLGIAFAGSLATLTTAWLGVLLKYLRPPQAQGFGGLVYAGTLQEFPPGSVNRVLAGRFYISHTDDGLLALYQKCTHLGCSVPYAEAESRFHCPCHGSLFNQNGEVTGGPAPRPLDIFPVKVVNGEVWVDTAQPIERRAYDSGQALKV